MNEANKTPIRVGRRAFLQGSTLFLLAAGPARPLFAADAPASVRVGLVTDMHYADKPAAGGRYYRESLPKLAEAVEQFAKDKPAVMVELGDFVDAASSPAVELSYLKQIHDEFVKIPAQRHYVLGNHCVDTLTKQEFLDGVGQKESFYSFDAGAVHFIVLDGCFRSDSKPYGRKNSQWNDANIPAAELEWLGNDLKHNDKPTVVFAHQRLDDIKQYAVKNAAEVRKLLEASGKVRAVFQGHSHKNDYQEIAGIHYCTLVAMVEGSGKENSGYSTMDVATDGSIRLTGFRKQAKYHWT